MCKSSPSRQGKEVLQKGNSICKDTPIHSLTLFTGDPDSTGNIPRFKALFNKHANQTILHICFLWRNLALDPNIQ